mgnify:FL=1
MFINTLQKEKQPAGVDSNFLKNYKVFLNKLVGHIQEQEEHLPLLKSDRFIKKKFQVE